MLTLTLVAVLLYGMKTSGHEVVCMYRYVRRHGVSTMFSVIFVFLYTSRMPSIVGEWERAS